MQPREANLLRECTYLKTEKKFLTFIFYCVILLEVKTSAKDEIFKRSKRVSYLVKKKSMDKYLDHFQDCALWIR